MELPRTHEQFAAFAAGFLWFSDEECMDALKSYAERRKMIMSRDEFDGDAVYVLWFEHMPDVWVAMYYDIHAAFDAVLWWNNKDVKVRSTRSATLYLAASLAEGACHG